MEQEGNGVSKDYQRKRNTKYLLPAPVYFKVVWEIRDYYRMKDMAQAILDESAPPSDGTPHGSPSADGVFNKASRRMYLTLITDIIDEELMSIPKEYRRGVWNNILYKSAFPNDADRSTYARYKSRMIYNIAERRGLI